MKLLKPVIELQFILMKHNQHETDDIKKFARETGVDKVKIKSVGIDLNDKDASLLAKRYLPDDEFASRYFITKDGKLRHKLKKTTTCQWIYQTSVINSNGDVVLCCYDLYDSLKAGNIFKNNFGKIWRGKKYKNFRRIIRGCAKKIKMCQACPEKASVFLK